MSVEITPKLENAQALAALRPLLADLFVVYMKTTNFYWHMSRRHVRDYHLLLDEYWTQIVALTEAIADRARNSGKTTITSVAITASHQRRKESRTNPLDIHEMLRELRYNNRQLARFLRSAHAVCREENDVVTAEVLKRWIGETERRTWLLAETVLGLEER